MLRNNIICIIITSIVLSGLHEARHNRCRLFLLYGLETVQDTLVPHTECTKVATACVYTNIIMGLGPQLGLKFVRHSTRSQSITIGNMHTKYVCCIPVQNCIKSFFFFIINITAVFNFLVLTFGYPVKTPPTVSSGS